MGHDETRLHELWRAGRENEFKEALFMTMRDLMISVVRDQVIDLHGRSQEDYACECLGDFWVDKLGPTCDRNGNIVDRVPRVNGMMQKCESDQQFIAYLKTAMTKWMRSYLIRQHPLGSLSESIRRRLRGDARFEQRGQSAWGIKGGSGAPSEVPIVRLSQIAERCPLELKEPKYGAQRAANIGARGELENMLYEVLAAAQGTLKLMVLAKIVSDRCRYISAVTTISADGWSALKNSDGGDWPRPR